jgi:flagellin
MRSQLAGQTTSAENIGRAVAMLQTADSGLEQIGNLLVRLKELAIQSADGTITTENRSGISSEAAGLISEIDRIADATEFNGISLLQSAGLATTGARTNLTFFIGDGTSASGQTATLQLKGVQFVASTGMGTVGDTGIGLTVADFLGQTSAANLVTGIDTGIDEIAKIRNDVGALQNRMERSLDNLVLAAENTTNAISTIRDADFAQEATALTRAQLLVQAGTSMLSQANVMPQTALLLLI